MIVVADTGPLRYLVLLDQVHILDALFRHVLVPEAVAAELTHERTPEAVKHWMANPPDWLEVWRSPLPEISGLDHLDPGERQAISLAQTSAMSLLLMDDVEGRAAAKSLGLGVVGTVGILESAAEAGLLDFALVFKELEQTNFHMSASFRQIIRERHRLHP